MRKIILFLFALCLTLGIGATDRWQMKPDGSIEWTPTTGLPHEDHIEMSGRQVSVVLRYGVRADGSFHVNKSMVWPMLRTIPNDTHASLMRRFDWDALSGVSVNRGSLTGEKVKSIRLDGMLRVESSFGECTVVRTFFPSADQPALIEQYELINKGQRNMTIELPKYQATYQTEASQGVYGSYTIVTSTDHSGSISLKPDEHFSFSASIAAYKSGQTPIVYDGTAEASKRQALLTGWHDNLVLETPDEVIDRMFAFSKIRACESIYQTACGPLHGPGGESYYAAIWANDQAEYIGPFFPYTGYAYGNASSLNAYEQFARFMNKDWKPIPSSIIAEGKDIWNGAGDRGDAAMIAYGASRYVMARGDKAEAQKLWPLIKWCLAYCNHKLNAAGVVLSDHDELEGRFPAGKANLCTSSLYYDALLSAAMLAPELGEGKLAQGYRKQAGLLRQAMNKYFAGPVEGFDTYAYYEGNTVLRAWICIPLVMGINERAAGTIKALFSPRLWTENGLLTQAGDNTFWDRSTLYALRGVYYAGETEKATDYLHRYSETRLLGDHVPYAIEAWPEGGQRHLSAESGLYGRILTEGLFGIRPTGLSSFSLKPHLPKAWDHAALRHIRAFAADFDIRLERTAQGKLLVTVTNSGKEVMKKAIAEGTTLQVKL